VIRTALESGVDWLDTSENYLDTQNESLIGVVLAQVEDDVLIASKAAPGAGVTGGGSGFRHDEIHAACRASLSRLGRDRLDLYFLHWPDRTGVPLEETWGAMAELADAGLVRAIGLSNYPIDDVERCHVARPVDVVQVGLSVIDYLDDRASIARCGELGIGVTIFEPLASGVLSGKTIEQVRSVWTGAWEETDFYRNLLDPVWGARCTAVVERLRAIGDRLLEPLHDLQLTDDWRAACRRFATALRDIASARPATFRLVGMQPFDTPRSSNVSVFPSIRMWSIGSTRAKYVRPMRLRRSMSVAVIQSSAGLLY
jgi:aryl-alcohol dehydrogenase-like predicted oxidoreductase